MIPSRFYEEREDNFPIAETVGDLKRFLDFLPDDLPLGCGASDSVQLRVYDHDSKNVVLELEEVEPDDEDWGDDLKDLGGQPWWWDDDCGGDDDE
jgi:hypothetical protein